MGIKCLSALPWVNNKFNLQHVDLRYYYCHRYRIVETRWMMMMMGWGSCFTLVASSDQMDRQQTLGAELQSKGYTYLLLDRIE